MSAHWQPLTWSACPVCWGQRSIVEPAEGRALVSVACPSCLGVGELATWRDEDEPLRRSFPLEAVEVE